MNKTILSLMLCCALASACKKSTTTPSYTPTCSGVVTSYKTNVQPIMNTYCVGCHTNYSTYAGVTAGLSGIRSTIVDGSMPQKTTLSDSQKNSVICWIDNGAQNN